MTLDAIVPSAHFADALPTPAADYRWWVWTLEGDPPVGLNPDTIRLAVVNGNGGLDRLNRLAELPQLEVVQVTGIGYEFVVPYLPNQAALCNAAGVNEDLTAELAVALALSSMRELPHFFDLQRKREWVTESASRPHPRGRTLVGKRVVVLGAGAVGTGVADRMAALGCNVTSVARTARTVGTRDVVAFGDVAALLPSADIVMSALPHTPQTEGIIDAAFLGAMANDALLVNIGRGSVVDTDALMEALHAGRIRAALDVTDPEPIPAAHPLWDCPNLVITPHVGGVADVGWERLIGMLDAQAARLARGAAPANIVVERRQEEELFG